MDPRNFQEAVDMLKISFGGGTLARNHILQYIQSNECKKPRKATVEEHVRRITTLVSLANQSAGTDAIVTKIKLNELLLCTMPNQWQQNFKLSGHTIADMTTGKFITYFSEVKDVYDSEQPTVRRNVSGGRFGYGQERGGRQPFVRGKGRFFVNGRGGQGRFPNWSRGRGGNFYRRNFNNYYRGGGSFNNYNGRYQRNQFNNRNARGFNRGTGTNGNTNNNRNYNNNQGNNRQTYWTEGNWWDNMNNQNNNEGNENNTNTQENRIVEVNHWETVNNNREGWDRTRYYNDPSHGR